MLPDPTLHWHPYPSIMDGIKPPPDVLDQGIWRGVLHLIVLECPPVLRAYGVEIRCEAYSAVDEMTYSVAGYGTSGGEYDGGVYIKEATTSRLIDTFAKINPMRRRVRHFAFVGDDYCYEILSCDEPFIRTFASEEEAYAWGPDRHT